jgi:hypothetical protein
MARTNKKSWWTPKVIALFLLAFVTGFTLKFMNPLADQSSLSPLTVPEVWVRCVCYLMTFIAVSGGIMVFVKDGGSTNADNDNVHRFLAGIYVGAGMIAAHCAHTVRQQSTLVYILALAVFLGGCGRLMSMTKFGLPKPAVVWLAKMILEFTIPVILGFAQYKVDLARGLSPF